MASGRRRASRGAVAAGRAAATGIYDFGLDRALSAAAPIFQPARRRRARRHRAAPTD